jgi:hypothetical protein
MPASGPDKNRVVLGTSPSLRFLTKGMCPVAESGSFMDLFPFFNRFIHFLFYA